MAAYRFRMFDKHGDVIGVHFLSLESDAGAKRRANTMLDDYDCERVEIWSGDQLIWAATRRLL